MKNVACDLNTQWVKPETEMVWAVVARDCDGEIDQWFYGANERIELLRRVYQSHIINPKNRLSYYEMMQLSEKFLVDTIETMNENRSALHEIIVILDCKTFTPVYNAIDGWFDNGWYKTINSK